MSGNWLAQDASRDVLGPIELDHCQRAAGIRSRIIARRTRIARVWTVGYDSRNGLTMNARSLGRTGLYTLIGGWPILPQLPRTPFLPWQGVCPV